MSARTNSTTLMAAFSLSALALVAAIVPAGAQAPDSVATRPRARRQARPAVAEQTLNLRVGGSSAYDSNLLQYSDQQITTFDAGTHPARYSIPSIGDVVWNPAVALAWELDEGHGRKHALRVRGEGDFHQQDRTADLRSASVRWRESFRRDRQFSLGGYALPNYYLRQLSDEDAPGTGDARYRRAEFALAIGSASWSQRIGRGNQLGLDYQFERRTYRTNFRERDSDTHQGETSWGWTRLPHRGAIELRAGYRDSKAKGVDGDEAPGVPPDDPDVSYNGWMGGAGGRMEFSRRANLRLGGDAAYEFGTRHYTSDRTADRYHFGRNDLLQVVEVGLRAQARPHWSARAFVRYESNDAKLGSAAPATSEAGSYHETRVGLSVEWSGDLWRSRGAGRAEAEE
jgi:hypothetical protein